MLRNRTYVLAFVVLLTLVGAAPATLAGGGEPASPACSPSQPAGPGGARLVPSPITLTAGDPSYISPDGFVPVAIWELRREGFPAIKHAWVAGSEKMLRVSWDDGVTWFAFRPLFTDTNRGLLALKVAAREEIGRGEVAWVDKAGMALTRGVEAKATLPATATSVAAEVTLKLLEVREVSPVELKQEAPKVGTKSADDGLVDPMSLPGGGGGSCCIICDGMRVCDCSVCITSCQTSCCVGGCYCVSC